MERIDSCHSVWLFDTEQRRYRRVPMGIDPDALALDSDWEPYFGLEISPESACFSVALNPARTRILRSWRHTLPCPHCGDSGDDAGADPTAELALAEFLEPPA